MLEPIKWRVIDKATDGSKALLASDQVLDFKYYRSSNLDTEFKSWADCYLRTWLNDTFYNKAFDSAEKAAIKKETLTTTGSVNTEDNVFVLSRDEANTLSQMDRCIKPTTYTKNVSRNNLNIRVFYGRVSWWLRSTGTGTSVYTDFVNENGELGTMNGYDGTLRVGVRPSIYIDLTSPYFTANESSITFNLDGGDWIKDNTTWKELNKYKEGVVNILPTADEVKKDWYVLKGWSINGNDLTEISINTTWTGNLTVKALWTYEGDRALTDRENNAFIVRDEWTAWVKSFTSELSALDKNAISRIYSNMDFYDMQYRFTEKYKKVPEYLDEDGKPTDKLKNLIKEKRKEIAGGSNKVKDYLKFTSTQNGSTVGFWVTGTTDYNMGYSKDGTTFIKWNPGENITLNSGEYIYVYNKTEVLTKNITSGLYFNLSGAIEASGNIMSILDFSDEVPYYGFYGLFSGQSGVTKASELKLPAQKVGEHAYDEMFFNCANLKEASDLPATTIGIGAYFSMFGLCANLEKGPYIKATSIGGGAFEEMFSGCTNLNYIKLDFRGALGFINWVQGVTATGKLYYNGPTTDHSNNKIPTNFTVVPF